MLAKWWWRDRTESDAKWKEVVLKCDADTVARRRFRNPRGVWNKILGIEKDLGKKGINLHRLMHLKEDGSRWRWELESDQNFTVRSLRKLIDIVSLPISDLKTEWIARLRGKVNIHVWRVLQDRIATMINVRKREVGLQSEDCPLCLSATESTDHVFALCSTTKVVCALLAAWVDWWPMNVTSAQDIWSAICSAVGDKYRKQVRKVIVAAFSGLSGRKGIVKFLKGA